jgi:hypothetical protein
MGDRWRYIVLAACFLINVLEVGTFKSFGVFLLPIQNDLQATTMSLGLAIAVCCSLGYLCGKYNGKDEVTT